MPDYQYKNLFTRTEYVFLFICTAILLIDLILLQFVQSDIDHIGFSFTSSAVVLLIIIGLFYRHVRNGGERVGVTMICAAFLILFSNVGAVLNYLMLSNSGEFIDLLLVEIDAKVGFHWLSFLEAMAQYPVFSKLLGYAYNSTLLQVVIVVILLGFTGRQELLYLFILSLMLTALLTIGFWILFPSFGPTAIYTIPEGLSDLIDPVVGNEYGEQLRALANNAQPFISPKNIQGIIAFPSYHTVMALLTCYVTIGIRGWRWVFLILNILVLWSIPLHGGHHLVDIFGSIVVCAIVILFLQRYRSSECSAIESSQLQYHR